MKLSALLLFMWSLCAGHSYGADLNIDMNKERFISDLKEISAGQTSKILNGESTVGPDDPINRYIATQRDADVNDNCRHCADVGRSPAIIDSPVVKDQNQTR